jgi:hypothetical protein
MGEGLSETVEVMGSRVNRKTPIAERHRARGMRHVAINRLKASSSVHTSKKAFLSAMAAA